MFVSTLVLNRASTGTFTLIFRPYELKIQNNLEKIQRFFLNYSELICFFSQDFLELSTQPSGNVREILKVYRKYVRCHKFDFEIRYI